VIHLTRPLLREMFGSASVLGAPRHGTTVFWDATNCRNAAPLFQKKKRASHPRCWASTTVPQGDGEGGGRVRRVTAAARRRTAMKKLRIVILGFGTS
jgi:hypothetical protein